MSIAGMDARAKAIECLAEAWAKADAAGVPGDVIASVALAKAYTVLVEELGPETAAAVAMRFPEEIRSGRIGGHGHSGS